MSQMWPQICRRGHDRGLLGTGCSDALEVADEEWKGAMGAVDDRIAELQRMLADCGSDSTPLEEFQKLLTKGHLSTGMLTFLTSTLGEPVSPALHTSMKCILRL